MISLVHMLPTGRGLPPSTSAPGPVAGGSAVLGVGASQDG